MSKHLERDLEGLRKNILMLGTLVEEATDKCIKAIGRSDQKMLEELFKGEERINQMEVDIEEECLKVLALHQPVATDLRFIVAVLKVNNDLERMGDQAINIADRVRALMGKPPLEAPVDFAAMGEVARRMVHLSLEALVEQDVELARRVGEMDDELDDIHAKNFEIVQDAMARDPSIIVTAVSYLTISSNLERIGDLSTNI
ncbi:MAG TPA: phosphate signaling complex protein PhoU, partial [Pseudomonadales bacterium]|nr:phosphate signaling complex protein PhoU [Pseudomonadales bacterium]